MIMRKNKRVWVLLIFLMGIAAVLWESDRVVTPSKPAGPDRTDLHALLDPPKRPDYAPVSEALRFPKDHGIHRGAPTEMWQLFGVLQTRSGRSVAIGILAARLDLESKDTPRVSEWSAREVYYFGYSILTPGSLKPFNDRQFSRDTLGLAGYSENTNRLWVYRRSITFLGGDPLPEILTLNIADGPHPLQLQIKALRTVNPGPATGRFRLYSISRMAAEGSLKLSEQSEPVSGTLYFEHGWGQLPAGPGQLIRNRFFVHLSNGVDLVLLQTRRRDGSGRPLNAGFMIFPDSTQLEIQPENLEINPEPRWPRVATGLAHPTGWNIRIPDENIFLELQPWKRPRMSQDLLNTRSEAADVSGRIDKTPVQGFANLRLSG